MPRYPLTSPSTATLSDSVFSGLVAKARAMPGPVHPLHVGDTYREPLPAARAEAQLTSDQPRLHNYAPVQGEPVFLDAIEERLARHGVAVDREDVQVTSGATSGVSVWAAGLVDPGDEVVIPAPYWPLVRGIVAGRGARPVELPYWDRLDDPRFDVEAALEAVVTERTVALYVNTPNNPTGRVMPDAAIAAFARVAARHDLWVLDDETYDDLDYRGVRSTPPWARPDLFDRTVAAHTLSKTYGLAGARVGFLHGPRAAMKALRGVQAFQTYCAPRPLQRGAARALREGDAWLAEARAAYAEAGRKAAAVLGVPPPDGGTFLFFDAGPHLREGEDVMGFLERCLEAGVLLTPGIASGAAYARWVRLCYTSVPPHELDDALERLARVLSNR
jgi:N-succinyldiaminopimelate aminotransferase